VSKIDCSLILACYNEGPTLEKSLVKILGQLKKSRGKWETIFVEDKSQDSTKKVIADNFKKFPRAKIIYHKQNMGRGKSVSDGILASRGRVCGYFDVDCEISPHYIPLFVKEVENGSDLVVGKRFYESQVRSLSRVIASNVYAMLIKTVLNLPVDDSEAGYKFFNRAKILPVLKKVSDKHWFWDTEICTRAHLAGLKVSQIPVLFIRRAEKKSTVKLLSDSIRYTRALINFKKEIKTHA